jgi:nucleoside phosphorylase
MHDVAIFAALAWECRAVLRALAVSVPVGGPRRWLGRLGDGSSVVVLQTGMGPDRARVAAAGAPMARLFLACGCAGGLAPELITGDLVAADGVIPVDASGRGVERIPAVGDRLGTWAARRGLDLRVGGIASSPCILADPAAKTIAAAGGALVVEMESAAIAREAQRRGVPFLGLRVVLDVATQAVPALNGIIDEATGEVHAGRALRALAPRPWAWPGALRLAGQERVAARQLGVLLRPLFGAEGLGGLIDPPDARRARSGG